MAEITVTLTDSISMAWHTSCRDNGESCLSGLELPLRMSATENAVNDDNDNDDYDDDVLVTKVL